MAKVVRDVLALGDQFSAAYASIRHAIDGLGQITYRREGEFATAGAVVSFIRDSAFDLVLMPNPYGNERRRDVYLKLKQIGFPVIVFDRGGLPDSWFFDVGFNADSPSYDYRYWDRPLGAEDHAKVRAYIEHVQREARPLEVQGLRAGGAALRERLGITTEKLLFVPLQRPSDTTIRFFAGEIGSYEAFLDVVLDVHRRCSSSLSGWRVVVKKHPLETARVAPGLCYVPDDTHINDLIEASDAVLLVNSGVGLLASLWDKPVLYAGSAYYGHEKLNRRVRTADDVERALGHLVPVEAETRDRLVHHLITSVSCVQAMVRYLFCLRIYGSCMRP